MHRRQYNSTGKSDRRYFQRNTGSHARNAVKFVQRGGIRF